MFIPIWIYLTINILKPLFCAPKLGGILSDPLLQEVRVLKFYQPQLSDETLEHLTINNNHERRKQVTKQTSNGFDPLQKATYFKYYTKFLNQQQSTQKTNNNKNTAKSLKLSRRNNEVNVLEKSNEINQIEELKPYNYNLKPIIQKARKDNDGENPKEPKKPCQGYIYDEKICKIVNDRVLCGYNRNPGEIKQSAVDLGNNCRMINNRIECGYSSPPYTNSRRPPADNRTTKPVERENTPSKGKEPETEIDNEKEGQNEQDQNYERASKNEQEPNNVEHEIPPSNEDQTTEHHNKDMKKFNGESEASKGDVKTKETTIEVQSNPNVIKQKRAINYKHQPNSRKVARKQLSTVTRATATETNSVSTACVDMGTNVVCYDL